MPKVSSAYMMLLGGLFVTSCGTEPADHRANEAQAQQQPVAFVRVTSDPLVHGERVARVLGCTGCHGADLTGKDWSEPGFGRLWTSNLTRAVPHYTDPQLERAIREGRRYDGTELWAMPSHLFTHLDRRDMESLTAWLRTQRPTGEVRPLPEFGPLARREIEAGEWRSSAADVQREGNRWPPDAGAGHALGRYIVRGTCAECHGMDLAGDRDQEKDRPAPPLEVVAAYDREQFRHLLRTGEPIGGRELRLMGEVARGRYAHLTDAETNAIYDYLRAVAAKP